MMRSRSKRMMKQELLRDTTQKLLRLRDLYGSDEKLPSEITRVVMRLLAEYERLKTPPKPAKKTSKGSLAK